MEIWDIGEVAPLRGLWPGGCDAGEERAEAAALSSGPWPPPTGWGPAGSVGREGITGRDTHRPRLAAVPDGQGGSFPHVAFVQRG